MCDRRRVGRIDRRSLRIMLQHVAICLLLPSAALGFQLPMRGVSFRTNRIVLSSANDGDADERSAEAKAEDDALAAAFNARLQKEGGATQVRELNACMCQLNRQLIARVVRLICSLRSRAP